MMQVPDIGEVVLHHTADAWTVELPFIGEWHLPRWPDVHLGPLTVNLSPTKHVFFLLVAAFLVFVTMWLTGRSLQKQRAHENAPKGFANAMEAFVFFVRDDIAIQVRALHHDAVLFHPLLQSVGLDPLRVDADR